MKFSKIEEDSKKTKFISQKRKKNRLTKTDKIQTVKTFIMNWFDLTLVITYHGLR